MIPPTGEPLRPDCRHTWSIYSPPKLHWWQRRIWHLTCHLCGGHAGGWYSKAEAIEHMTSDDWGRR